MDADGIKTSGSDEVFSDFGIIDFVAGIQPGGFYGLKGLILVNGLDEEQEIVGIFHLIGGVDECGFTALKQTLKGVCRETVFGGFGFKLELVIGGYGDSGVQVMFKRVGIDKNLIILGQGMWNGRYHVNNYLALRNKGQGLLEGMVYPVAVLDRNPVYLGLVVRKFVLEMAELVWVNGNINGYIFL